MLADEEEIVNLHTECVKEDAMLLTDEGQLITTMQSTMREAQDYDMASYMTQVESVARKKLEMYQELLRSIEAFRGKYHRRQ